jgi:hypothetical protein
VIYVNETLFYFAEQVIPWAEKRSLWCDKGAAIYNPATKIFRHLQSGIGDDWIFSLRLFPNPWKTDNISDTRKALSAALVVQMDRKQLQQAFSYALHRPGRSREKEQNSWELGIEEARAARKVFCFSVEDAEAIKVVWTTLSEDEQEMYRQSQSGTRTSRVAGKWSLLLRRIALPL